MKRSEIDDIRRDILKKLTLGCTTFHQHSAQNGCYTGCPEYLVICQLCEELLFREAMIHDAEKSLKLALSE